MTKDKIRKVALAGASGFIGKALTKWLLEHTDYIIVALSRRDYFSDNPRLIWRKADLFSLLEVENALVDIDYAYYLVHSMLPSAHLDQGSFEDYDLLLSDNFARACQSNGIQQLIYLGGIIPPNFHLSRHLKSRHEVELVFRGQAFAFTALRAGIVLGNGGSSFNIMYNLVCRLPIIICPSWCKSKMTPIHIQDATASLGLVLGAQEYFNKTYDIGGSTTHSYLNLLQILAKKLKLKRKFVLIQFTLIKVSRLWVRLFSGASKELIYPLLDSLKHSMILDENKRLPLPNPPKSYEESLDEILSRPVNSKFSKGHFKRNYVRSVQRLHLPPQMDAREVAREYMRWLPRFLFPFLLVRIEDDIVHFCLLSPGFVLLRLRFSPERSTQGRSLFYISGGILAIVTKNSRLEFRETLDQKYILTAIHDFRPSLPWWIYCYTQAIIHLFVMNKFGKHLKNISQGENK